MRTLYISDLDGTLLNKDAEISDFTRETLNRLINKGMNFSVATARTSETVRKILEGINLNIPVILMNGVCIYDIVKNVYVKIEGISFESKVYMVQTLKKHNISGFLYTIDNGFLATLYENTDSPNAKAFIEERVRKYNKPFTKVDDFSHHIVGNVIYFSISDKKEKLFNAYRELISDGGLHVEFYRDIYNEDSWYMEVCSEAASKYNAVNYLKEHYGFDRVVGFGDNLNDLPLFRASDESYAVQNANPEVKGKATGVIESNIHDGVAKWLDKNV